MFRILTLDPDRHPFRLHILKTWTRADERSDMSARKSAERILNALDEISEIYRSRQLAFSGAAFVFGFLTAINFVH
jgi:hypothetical protein